MPRCACTSEVYGSVFVCVSVVCVCKLLQLLKINEVYISKSFYRLLVMFSFVDLQNKASFSSYA